MVIVTQNQYILASKIHHITLDEHKELIEFRLNGKWQADVLPKFTISIYYAPDNGSSNVNDIRECVVYMTDKHDARKVYKDLISQIREQMPDQLYLDKAFENLLKQDVDIKTDTERRSENRGFLLGKRLLGDYSDDGKSTKIRKPRKKKRRSKDHFISTLCVFLLPQTPNNR